MRVLAVDTATFMGTVAITDGGRLVAEIGASVRAAHGETLLPLVKQTLAQARMELADLDLLAVGLGPGSFTGVRIGVATLKGLSLARGTPLVGVGSLRTMAAGMLCPAEARVPIIDAYKGEVYAAVYDHDPSGALRELLAPLHALPQEAARQVREALGERTAWTAGDGVVRYPELLGGETGAPALSRAPAVSDAPRAAALATLAERAFEQRGPDDLAALEPLYVRASDATLPARALRLVPPGG